MPIRELKYDGYTCRIYGSGWWVFDIGDDRLVVRGSIVFTKNVCSWAMPANQREGSAVALKKVADELFGRRALEGAHLDKGDYPCILEHLVEAKYPDGTERQTSSLVVVADATNWRVCLSDRDNARVMWKTGTTLLEALQAIELGLMADDPSDWRKAATAAAKRKK